MNVWKRLMCVGVVSLLAAGIAWAQPSLGGVKQQAHPHPRVAKAVEDAPQQARRAELNLTDRLHRARKREVARGPSEHEDAE